MNNTKDTKKKITILNVDDWEPDRYMITRILKQAGFEVLEAECGRETLEKALKRSS